MGLENEKGHIILICFWSYFNERGSKEKQAERAPVAVSDSSWHLPAQTSQCLWTGECVRPVRIERCESKVNEGSQCRERTTGHVSQTNPDVLTTAQAWGKEHRQGLGFGEPVTISVVAAQLEPNGIGAVVFLHLSQTFVYTFLYLPNNSSSQLFLQVFK